MVRRASPQPVQKFRTLVWNHYRREGRHALPWRHARNPYRIAVSEVMLQQTQVARVLSFYPKFITQFPSFHALAKAPRREVLRAWQGLGYNRRAVALQRLAQDIVKHHRGKLPRDRRSLEALPGLGRATAGSILAFAYDISTPFIETNIRRAFLHYFFPHARNVREEEILSLVEKTLPKKHARKWYYALMDYGNWLVKHTPNPNRRHARYRTQPKFAGSQRELRGKILRYLLAHPRTPSHALAKILEAPAPRVKRAYDALKKEGLVT